MSASNEELTKAICLVAKTVALMAETDTALARMVLPMANHLDPTQKAELSAHFDSGLKSAEWLRGLTDILNSSTIANQNATRTNKALGDLSEALIYLFSIVGGLVEMNTRLSSIVVPLASNLTDEQKSELLALFAKGPELAASCRALSQQYREWNALPNGPMTVAADC